MYEVTRCKIIVALLLFAGLNCTAPGQSAEWPFHERQGVFHLHADFDLDRYAILLRTLANLQVEVHRQLALNRSAEQIDVYLFSDEEAYQAYMHRYFPHIRPRRAMFVKANSPGNVFAYDSAEFGVDLRHESTHAVLHAALPYVPLWLDEGLAEYYELTDDQRERGHEHLKSVRRSVFWKRPRALIELETINSLEKMGRTEYRDSWAWVHFMLHGPQDAKRELTDYLAEISRGKQPKPLSTRLAERYSNLDEEFAAHFKKFD
ncbi:MAG: hypothetical protein KDA60_08025 [Planctomycetales bacterium]|nr:hypothetical protein [Planctomycetales bacterium]